MDVQSETASRADSRLLHHFGQSEQNCLACGTTSIQEGVLICIHPVHGPAPVYIKALSLQIDYSPLPGDNKCRADTSQVYTVTLSLTILYVNICFAQGASELFWRVKGSKSQVATNSLKFQRQITISGTACLPDALWSLVISFRKLVACLSIPLVIAGHHTDQQRLWHAIVVGVHTKGTAALHEFRQCSRIGFAFNAEMC